MNRRTAQGVELIWPGRMGWCTRSMFLRLRERAGTIHVEVVPNTDPEDFGHPLVAVGFEEDLFRGFPCVTGTIAYAGTGPRAWMGWVQVIERRDVKGTVTIDVDTAPVFATGSPLYAFGYLPTFSDFPANPDHPDGDLVAETFLVAIPDVIRSSVLVPVAAFSWGYRLRNHRPVQLFPPEQLELSAWDARRDLLGSRHADWTFEPTGYTDLTSVPRLPGEKVRAVAGGGRTHDVARMATAHIEDRGTCSPRCRSRDD